MEISADGSASIIGVRRTEVLVFNFQDAVCSPNNRELRETLSPPCLKYSFSTLRVAERHFGGGISKSSSTYRELGVAF